MTQKLLTFARRQEIEFVEVDLNELIKGVENMIRRLLPANISVRFLQSLQSPHVLADAGQLEQVVVNLCVNARDAMSKGRESDSDRLTITVGEKSGVDDDGEFREYALISIEDTGAGIPSSVVDKIFEPFFTTKDEGEGTGLGLSVVYGIIKRHGGTIDVDSEPGRGTRFEVQLPLIDPVRTQVLDIPAKSTEPETRSSLSHTAGILLVEDNDQVRRLCEQVLSGCGYEMFTAVNGQDGIEVFEENADNIDLVIVDLVMPKRGGRDVFEAIRTVKPSTRVLFSTGYASHSEQARFISEYGLEMIEKPYTPETLCRRVEALLDRDPAVGQ